MRAPGSPRGGWFAAPVIMALAACGSSSGRADGDGNRVSASASTGSSASASTGSSAVSLVSCTGSTCQLTLAGAGSAAQVLGRDVRLQAVNGSRATLRVGDATVTCVPGDLVTADVLRLACSSVADGAVRFTVTPR